MFYSRRRERGVGRICLKFWVPKTCFEGNPYLEEINRKLETTLLHQSPKLRNKTEMETQWIAASSKMRWSDPTAKIFVASHLGDQIFVFEDYPAVVFTFGPAPENTLPEHVQE